MGPSKTVKASFHNGKHTHALRCSRFSSALTNEIFFFFFKEAKNRNEFCTVMGKNFHLFVRRISSANDIYDGYYILTIIVRILS